MAEPVRDIRDVQVRLGQLRQEWDSFRSNNYNRKGLRLTNNGRSVDIGDYVIRGEVNDLIREAIINLDKLELTQVFTNIAGAGGGLKNPLVESIRASLDSTYDIGEPAGGNRIRWIFSDVTNSEILEVTDTTTHLLHWQFLQDPATSNELDLKQPSNAIVVTFKTSSVEFFQDLIIGNNGSSDVKDILMRGNVRGVQPIIQMEWATDNVAFQSPGPLAIFASYHPTPADIGAVELQTTSAGNSVFRPSSTGGIAITNYFLGDLNVPWQEIYAMQLTARHISGGAPLVRWDDQAGSTTRFANIVGPPASGSSWTVELPNVGPGGSGNVLADSGVNGTFGDQLQWLSVTNPPYSIIPASHNTYDLGSSTSIWNGIFGKELTLGKSSVTRLQGFLRIANASDSNVFEISGTSSGHANVPSNRQLKFEDSVATVRAIIGVDSDEGFVNCSASGGNVLLVTSGTAGNNSVWINSNKIIGPQGAAISDATGGATVDTEARAAINALLARCRAHGLIAT